MAFTQNTLSKSSTGYAHKVSGQEWIYSNTTDTLAEIKADGYFDKVASLFSVGETLNVGDLTFERDLIEIIEINPTAPKVKTREFVGSGSIPDGSITTAKLANLAVTTPKLADLAVTTDKLDLAAVTIDRIDNLAVTTEKIADLAVTALKLDLAAVTTDRIDNVAITTAKIADLAVTSAKTGPNILGAFRIINIFEIPAGTQVTKVIPLPGALPGDFATAAFSFNNSLVVFIIESRFVAPASITVSFNFVPGVSDKIQIFHYRAITG